MFERKFREGLALSCKYLRSTSLFRGGPTDLVASPARKSHSIISSNFLSESEHERNSSTTHKMIQNSQIKLKVTSKPHHVKFEPDFGNI